MIFAFLNPVEKVSFCRHSQGAGGQLTETSGKNVQRLKKNILGSCLALWVELNWFVDKFTKSA